jgi:hypothetical protein
MPPSLRTRSGIGRIRPRRELRAAGAAATALNGRVGAVRWAIGGVLAPVAPTTSTPTSAASRPLAARTLLPAGVAIARPRRLVATSRVVGAGRLIGAGRVAARPFLTRRSIAARTVIAPGRATRSISRACGSVPVRAVAARIAACVARTVAPGYAARAVPAAVPIAVAIVIAVPVTAATAAAVSIGPCIALRRSIALRRRRL